MTRISALALAGMSLSFIRVDCCHETSDRYYAATAAALGREASFTLKPLQVVALDAANTVIGLKLFLTSKHPFSLDDLLTPSGELPK